MSRIKEILLNSNHRAICRGLCRKWIFGNPAFHNNRDQDMDLPMAETMGFTHDEDQDQTLAISSDILFEYEEKECIDDGWVARVFSEVFGLYMWTIKLKLIQGYCY